MDFVSNLIQNSVAGFVDSGMRTVGGYAGDALNKAGDYIESGGAAYGNMVQSKFDTWGNSIRGVGPVPSTSKAKTATTKALPRTKTVTGASTTARPKAVQRSNSTPAGATGKVKTGTAGTPKKNVPAAKRTTVTRTNSTPGAKPAAGMKYMPGVVTGMAKQGSGAGKGGPAAAKKSEGSGGAKYTPGVVTGMAKGASGKTVAGAKANGGGGGAKYTPGVVTGMGKKTTTAVKA